MSVTPRKETMCQACFGYIHDSLVSPVEHQSPYAKHIHAKSLKAVAEQLTQYLIRCSTSFKQGDLFFICPERLKHSDPFIQSQQHDEFIWTLFLKFHPNHKEDLTAAIDLLLDNGVIRKTAAPHQLAELFLKLKFHEILKVINMIHYEHSNKINPPNQPRTGNVPAWKIAMLKAKSQGGTWIDHFKVSIAAIPPLPPNEKLSIRVPLSIDDDPLYW